MKNKLIFIHIQSKTKCIFKHRYVNACKKYTYNEQGSGGVGEGHIEV